jgi:hypothetical protein
MTVRIYIDHRVIRSNKQTGAKEPPIVVLRDDGMELAHSVSIPGPCKVVHGKDRPLIMGVRVWIEAEDVEITA